MINERYREDRERRRLGSLTVYSGPTHSGKTKKLEAEAERAQRQGRRLQRLASPSDPNALLNQLDPATELVTVDDAQQYDDRLVEALKPALDDRYAIEAVASHREIRFPAIAVPDAAALRSQVHDDTRVIGIDEAQFFEPDIVTLAEELANRGRHVIIAGLDLDFLSRPF